MRVKYELDIDAVADHERQFLEPWLERVAQHSDYMENHKYRHRVAGGFRGLMGSPPLLESLRFMGRQLTAQQGRRGGFLPYDHEIVDLVLSFDSGHWGLVANHVPYAVASGVSVETIELLRDGREAELPASDRQLVDFTRAVRDGQVTDALWDGMVDRFGTERGVVEYVFQIVLLVMHLLLIQAFDDVQITREELDDMLKLLRRGEFPLPEVANDGRGLPGREDPGPAANSSATHRP
jgi:hypothetical protein